MEGEIIMGSLTGFTNSSLDIRDVIFNNIQNHIYTARISSREEGVIAGISGAIEKANNLGLTIIDSSINNGERVTAGSMIMELRGTPKQLVQGEEQLLGEMGKYSGIATAARRAKIKADKKLRVVSGGWKKMPVELKKPLRNAIKIGGLDLRISDQPFVYLDKNYVRIFGGIKETLLAVEGLERLKIIQLKSEFKNIQDEALEAVTNGADIIMVDTGCLQDCQQVSSILKEKNYRDSVKIAFGGGISINEIEKIKKKDIDIIDIGREIVDAPLLDLSFDIIAFKNNIIRGVI